MICQINKIGLCGNSKNRFFDKSIQIIVTKNGYTPFNSDVSPQVINMLSGFFHKILFYFLQHTPFDGIVSINMAHWAQTIMKKDNMNDIEKV